MKTKKLKTLLSKNKIQKRISILGKKITADYKGKDLVVVCVLKGAFMFCADLIRAIDLPLTVEFFGVQSYGNNTHSSGIVKTTLDVDISLEGKDVLIIEDIVDSGRTISFLKEYIQAQFKPNTLKVASLLNKKARREVNEKADYVGFEIGDHFLVGYGLDSSEEYRHLPYLAVCE